MIVGAAVCPGAPFLIPGTADAIARQLSSVVDACSVAVARLPDVDTLLLITSAATGSVDADPQLTVNSPAWQELSPGRFISTTPLRRSDVPDRSSSSQPADGAAGVGEAASSAVVPLSAATLSVATLSVGTMVGTALLSAGDHSSDTPVGRGGNVRRQPPATTIEITGDPAAVAAMVADRCDAAERVALLVIADGSACHGADAPGRRDDRAGPFDAALADALATGDPIALRAAAADRDLGRALLASVDPLAVLALLTDRRPPATADLLYAGAPLGVGYLVASWGWDDR